MNRILIVEDDEAIGAGIKLYLEKRELLCTHVTTFAAAQEALQGTLMNTQKAIPGDTQGNPPKDTQRNHKKVSWDMVILDQNLPDGSGMDLCHLIRKNGTLPIIFLTAKDTASDMVEGFEAGCDDYLAKPFDIQVLYQRVLAVLRRSATPENSQLFRYRRLTVDFSKMHVQIGDEPVKLTVTEYKILELLIQNKGQVLTREQIFEKVWDIDGNFVDENTLNVHIRRLRSKLEEDAKNPQYILTVFGIGYTFGE